MNWREWFKSAYTRSLEEEVKRLREELSMWQDALLQKERLPAVHLREREELPKLKKRLLPSQFRAQAERMTIPVEKKPDA